MRAAEVEHDEVLFDDDGTAGDDDGGTAGDDDERQPLRPGDLLEIDGRVRNSKVTVTYATRGDDAR